MKTLQTQADVNAACAGRYQVGAVTIDPTEPIDLSRWIAPHECCGSCGHVEDGLPARGGGRGEEGEGEEAREAGQT